MPGPSADEPEAGLPPPGSRWGAGAQSVLPFLTKWLQSKPASTPEPREARLREDRPAGSRRNTAPTD